ncbi:hypothetical protein MK489_14500 [Myxococcota bacterium]|nr:hypothetical protein [Myxococcota bacterium]
MKPSPIDTQTMRTEEPDEKYSSHRWKRLLVLFAGIAMGTAANGTSTQPLPVEVGVYVLDISEIQELQQSVVVDFAIIASWQQNDLADPGAPELRVLPLAQVDSPRLFVINGRNLKERFEPLVDVDRKGRVIFRQRYQGTLSIPMNLKDFPMDIQTFEVEIGTLDHRNRVLIPDPSRSGKMRSFTVAGWNVAPQSLSDGKQLAPDGIHSYATITATYSAQRSGLFFAWKLFIPLGLIVLMAYTVFWLDPTVLATQIGIATSAVFTLIAYNFALSNILPPISYLTRADFYLMGCMLLVFGALGEAVVTGILAREDRRLKLARQIDIAARFVYPALFMMVLTIAFR